MKTTVPDCTAEYVQAATIRKSCPRNPENLLPVLQTVAGPGRGQLSVMLIVMACQIILWNVLLDHFDNHTVLDGDVIRKPLHIYKLIVGEQLPKA